jgi:hypothetical protein
LLPSALLRWHVRKSAMSATGHNIGVYSMHGVITPKVERAGSVRQCQTIQKNAECLLSSHNNARQVCLKQWQNMTHFVPDECKIPTF